MTKQLLWCLLLAKAEEDHHDDDHGSELPYEWAGIFKTEGDNFAWIAQKVKGEYADLGMKIVALAASEASQDQLDSLAEEGEHSLEATCTELHAGDTIVPQEDVCYELHFDQTMPATMFKVDGSSAQAIAFFAQHLPTEFAGDTHYFKAAAGTDLKPVAILPKDDHSGHDHSGHDHSSHAEEAPPDTGTAMGAAIGAAIIVNIVTLIGVVFMIPVFGRLSENYAEDFTSIMSAFAAGAILSCAFFLLLFEATHLIASGWDKEVDVLWRWGTAILAGYSLPVLTQLVASALASDQKLLTDGATENADTKDKAKSGVVSRSRIMSGVLIGDFFHNLCDGFFLGAAFKGCGSDFGWRVLVGTAAHELAQELADYLVLTGPDAKLRPVMALTLNFVSGLGVLLGTIIVMSSEVTNDTIGILLAVGGGVYLHVAATECMPKVYSEHLSLRTRLGCVAAFFLGAVGIGLVLLDHEHCAAGDAHAGHDH